MKKTMFKCMAMLLCVCTLLSIIPMQAFATDLSAPAVDESIEDNAEQQEVSNEILCEVTEKRDEHTKVYQKADGTYTAMISSQPLHYMQNGEWLDIDNTFTEATRNGTAVYTNTDNPLDVALPQTLSQENGIVLTNNGYTLQFTLSETQQSEIAIADNSSALNTPSQEDTAETASLKTTSETALYEDVLPHTDLEYSISAQTVKENIVIQRKSAVRDAYTFSIYAPGLSAVLQADNAVAFVDNAGTEIFKIPAPFMKDAVGAVSTEIATTLQATVSDTYSLTYAPSQEWLLASVRQYPVMIDPIIRLGEEDWFTACTVKSSAPTENYHSSVLDVVSNGIVVDEETGEQTNNGEYFETYVQFYTEQLDILTEDMTPVDVELVFTGAGMNLAAYEITEDFDPDTVTYQTKPQYSAEPIDYYTGVANVSEWQLIHFNITKPFSQWLSGDKENHGIAIYSYDNSAYAAGFFLTQEAQNGGAFLYIDFVESYGYNSRFDYHTQDVGRAGTSYINDFSQRLLLCRDDISISGNIMPVTVSMVYNPAIYVKLEKYIRLLNNLGEETPTVPAVYGNGWLTNYNRILFVNDVLADGNGMLCYADGNGNILHFAMQVADDGTITFEDDNTDIFGSSGYEIIGYENMPASCNALEVDRLKLKTPNGEIEEFDANGRLVKIYKENYPDNCVTIAYKSDLQSNFNFFAIDSITDGVGRKFQFSYPQNGVLLENIQCFAEDGNTIQAGDTSSDLKTLYSYDESGNLTQVTYPDGALAKYEYDTNNRLTAAISRNMYKLNYTYDDFGRVRSVSEYAQDISTLSGYTLGNSITVAPDGPRQVTFRDGNGVTETAQFDKYGRTALVTDARGNYTDTASGAQRTNGVNLLGNQSFEDGWQNWATDGSTHFTIVDTDAYAGAHSVKCEAAEAASDGFSQTVSCYATGTFTFSAYIRAQAGFTGTERLMMQIDALDSEGELLDTAVRTVAATSDTYTRYSVSLNVPNGVAALTVSLGFEGTAGTFYADCLQLEKGSGYGAYNLLEDSQFWKDAIQAGNPWQHNFAYSVARTPINGYHARTISLPASKTADYTMAQTVAIDGHAGDFVTISGWMKADVVSNGADNALHRQFEDTTHFTDDRFAGITLTYTYTTEKDGETVTETETVKKAVNDFIADWQFVSETVLLKGDCTAVTFAVEYKNHPAAVAWALPCLSYEQAPVIETTDEEPELPETASENAETGAETPARCVCGATCEYGAECPCTCANAAECTCPECKGCVCAGCTRLGCSCRCASEQECTCPQCKKLFDIQYDEYGNLTSLTISGYNIDTNTLLSMFTARTFSAGGNYMTSATDENGNTVLYNYDTSNGMLSSLTDARGNATQYTYNAMGALAEVRTPVSGLASEALGLVQPPEMVTNYSYLNDRLVQIRHNGFSYFIDYDRWNNVDRLYANTGAAAVGAVLNSAVADYTYGTGVNHSRLESVCYGNGDTVHYRYDAENRVIGISYDGGATDRFRYCYDAFGNVTCVVDNETDRTVFYNENSVEVYTSDGLLYFCNTDSAGNTVEYIEGAYTYTAKPTETTRNAETKISASKTEISVNDNTLALLQSTDMFGRVLQKAVTTGNADTAQENTAPFAAVVSEYTYENAGTSAKSRVATLQNRVTYGTAMTAENAVANYSFNYEYDANGNITAEYAVHADNSHTLRYRYTYDEANQLTRVDDNVRGKTFVYQYDEGGNRVSEKIYAYTLSNSLGAVQQTNESKYTFLTWKDRLSSYNGKSITYDLAGNPKQYGDTTYVWAGKQLVEIRPGDGSKTQFEYDADGLRTQKRQYGTDGRLEYFVDYVWQNGKLTQQILTLMGYRSDGSAFKIGPLNTKFVYDGNSDQPTACFVGEQQMLFVRNLQGDILAVATSDGEVVAEFSYDAWGNVEYTIPDGVDETWATFIPLFCPLTYRGYNYDFTTGLYYLQSRYYNPEWGRFMNVDDTSILLATQGTSHGANLFAYCENNPVNQVDYSGKKSEKNNNDILCEMLELILPFVSEKYFNVKLNRDKTITFSLKTSYEDFYKAMKKCCRLNSEFTYFIVTLIANGFIKSKTNRYFLFSIDCMYYEIKFHFELYKISKVLPKNQQVVTDPTASIGIGISNGLYLLGSYLNQHCQDCDIAENDVTNKTQAINFNYNNGIRSVYYNTLADPYYKNGKRQSYSVVPEEYTEWKNYLYQYGYIRDGVI